MGIFDAGSPIGAIMEGVGGIGADIGNLFSASAQRDWETNMANTAHQREVVDLRKAGLNPILSGLGGQGAATPTAPMAQMQNPFSGMTTALNQVSLAKAQKDNLDSQSNQAEANANLLGQKLKTEATQQQLNSAAALKNTMDAHLTVTQAKGIIAAMERDQALAKQSSASTQGMSYDNWTKWQDSKLMANPIMGPMLRVLHAMLPVAGTAASMAGATR